MIRCFMDALISEDSECAWCCIYCKKECEYRCKLSSECNTEENVFDIDCPNAYER